MIHKNITIRGRVQGVGFRFSARNAARQYGIKGFVKNLPDGSVYIEAEAPEYNMNLFLTWCEIGPSHAIIDELNISEGELKKFSVFDILI